MTYCGNLAPLLLLHVSLLLALIAGAGLATAARLKWDPSTYIVIRELFPIEYYAAAVVLSIAPCTLLTLGHLAALAVNTKARMRRVLYTTYALLMVALVVTEVTWGIWIFLRIIAWLQTPRAVLLLNGLGLVKILEYIPKFILRWLSQYNPAAGRIYDLIEEVEDDIPRNLYVGIGAVLLLGFLQFAAILLSLFCILRTKQARPPHRTVKNHSFSPLPKTDRPHLVTCLK